MKSILNWSNYDPEALHTNQANCQPYFSIKDWSRPKEGGSVSFTIRVAKTWKEVEELRPVWQSWTTGLHTELEHYEHSLKNDKTAVGPCVISVWRGETPLGILAGQIKERKASATVAMVRVNGPRVRLLEIVTKGRLGPVSAEIDRLLAAQLAKLLREGSVELAYFHRLPIDSSLYRSVWELRSLLTRKRTEHVFSYSEVPLIAPQGSKPAVFSGKIMREARRKKVNLEREFSGRVCFRCFSQISELADGLNDVEKVNQGSWQNSLGSDFTDPLQTADSFRFFAEKGWLRIFVLYAADRPAAFLIGLLHGKNFHCQHAGYHVDFAKHSVGSVLTNMAFENLAAAGVERVDLGEGGQEHNRRLRCEKNEEASVHVYAPTLRGLYLSLFFGMAQSSRSLGSWARTRLHLEWAGKKWREFLLDRRARASTGALANRFSVVSSTDSFGLVHRHEGAGSCK